MTTRTGTANALASAMFGADLATAEEVEVTAGWGFRSAIRDAADLERLRADDVGQPADGGLLPRRFVLRGAEAAVERSVKTYNGALVADRQVEILREIQREVARRQEEGR